jgi:hypothetical protein
MQTSRLQRRLLQATMKLARLVVQSGFVKVKDYEGMTGFVPLRAGISTTALSPTVAELCRRLLPDAMPEGCW